MEGENPEDTEKDEGRKYGNCVIKPRTDRVLPYHHPGEYNIYVDKELYPHAKFWLGTIPIPKLSPEELKKFKENYVPHTHDVDEIDMVIGKEGAAKFEVTLSYLESHGVLEHTETHVAECPCTIYIPAGVKHHLVPIEVKEPITVVATILKGRYP